MDFHRPREYDPSLLLLHSQRLTTRNSLGFDYEAELSDLDTSHDSIPLETYMDLQARYQRLCTDFETYKTQMETQRQMERTSKTLILNTIEQYKSQIETLRAKDHLNMQLITTFQSQITSLELQSGLKAVISSTLPSITTLEVISKEAERDYQSLNRQETERNESIKLQEEVNEVKNINEMLRKRVIEEKNRADKAVEAAKKAIEYARKQTEIGPGRKKRPDIGLNEVRNSLKRLKEFVIAVSKKMPIILVKQVKDSLPCSALQSPAVLQDLSSKYIQELFERRRLYNKLQELKGNIRVVCRVRPCVSSASCLSIRDNILSIFPENRLGTPRKDWEFDSVLSETSSQEDTFECIKPFIQSSVDGYNVCIFAYGQTGAGKTYTMEGTSAQPGVNYRTAVELFRLIEERKPAWRYEVEGGMVEIYNDKVRDLLGNGTGLRVRHGDAGVQVPTATYVRVNDPTEVTLLLDSGATQRAIGQTNLNQHSSRSHLVFTLKITGECQGVTISSQLHLIDLAGSERLDKSGSEGERLKEATFINKSLFALGDVLTARRNKERHVPYRNSTLTHLLQDSLSGDSKVLMILQVSPEQSSYEETLCSLQFGVKARATELGVARKRIST